MSSPARQRASAGRYLPFERANQRPFFCCQAVTRIVDVALGPRILHVTDLARHDSRFHEVHPEVSFRAMNDGRPLGNRKKSAGGALERLRLLGRHGIELNGLSFAASASLDDVLDASAAAWSADRIARSQARTLPDPPESVAGLPVAIWY